MYPKLKNYIFVVIIASTVAGQLQGAVSFQTRGAGRRAFSTMSTLQALKFKKGRFTEEERKFIFASTMADGDYMFPKSLLLTTRNGNPMKFSHNTEKHCYNKSSHAKIDNLEQIWQEIMGNEALSIVVTAPESSRMSLIRYWIPIAAGFQSQVRVRGCHFLSEDVTLAVSNDLIDVQCKFEKRSLLEYFKNKLDEKSSMLSVKSSSGIW